jgi:hypothetical protein
MTELLNAVVHVDEDEREVTLQAFTDEYPGWETVLPKLINEAKLSKTTRPHDEGEAR